MPNRLYVGKKGFNAQGQPASDFLSRNGLAYGQVYGFATDLAAQTNGLFMDDFHKESVTGHGVPGARVEGAFEPIDWRWDGTVKDFVNDGSWEFQHDAPSRAEINWRETAPPRVEAAQHLISTGAVGQQVLEQRRLRRGGLQDGAQLARPVRRLPLHHLGPQVLRRRARRRVRGA